LESNKHQRESRPLPGDINVGWSESKARRTVTVEDSFDGDGLDGDETPPQVSKLDEKKENPSVLKSGLDILVVSFRLVRL